MRSAASCKDLRAAARRADAPHPAAIRSRRNAPWVMPPRAGRAGRLAPGVPVAGRRSAHRAGTPRIVRVGPSGVKGTRRSFLTAAQKRPSGPTLERWRPNADPAGLTARARPKARPEGRAANLTGEKWLALLSFIERGETAPVPFSVDRDGRRVRPSPLGIGSAGDRLQMSDAGFGCAGAAVGAVRAGGVAPGHLVEVGPGGDGTGQIGTGEVGLVEVVARQVGER